jgi:predicted Zn-dependent protease
MATDIGSVLGQDGDALAQVSGTFAQFIVSGELPVASAGTYATNLITGAVKSKLPVTDFLSVTNHSSGGVLGVTAATINAGTVADFEAIEDQFADAIVSVDSTLTTKAEATKLATALGTLAGDVAKFTKGIQFNNGTSEVYVAQYLAGTLAEFIDAEVPATITPPFSPSSTPRSLAIAAIKADIDSANGNLAAVESAVTAAITAAAGNPNAYQQYLYGSITTDETAVTNL